MELNEQIENICKGLEQNNYTNEASVSRNIVDPLLAALGWSTNPNVVIPEYKIDGKRVDFALCHPASKPCIFIEVKQVGKIDGAERQLFEYAFHEGIPILILTDGKKWRFYNPSGVGVYTERLVYEFDMIDDDRVEIVNHLKRYLNYDLVRTGKALTTLVEDYQNVYQNREILRLLPQVWDNLVMGKSEDSYLLINAVKSESERICGITPTDEQVSNFLKDTHSESDITPVEDRVELQPQSSQNISSEGKNKYTTYFQKLIDELRENYNFTKARVAREKQNSYSFRSGYSGIAYKAHFSPKEKVFTAMHINFRDYEKNKTFYDVLIERKDEINAKIDKQLKWERRDDMLRCVISMERDGNIEVDKNELAAIKAWHIQSLLKFKEVFTPEIQNALEKLKSKVG